MSVQSPIHTSSEINRKRQRSNLHDDNYEMVCSIKEAHICRPLIARAVDPIRGADQSRIRTLSNQSVYIPHSSSILSKFDRVDFMRNHCTSLRDILFSSKVAFVFRNENGPSRGVTGLMNLGNTCYMNAALQALSNCPPIRDYFCVLNIDSKFSSPEACANAEVSMAFRDLLERIWSDAPQLPIKPTIFLFKIRNKCPQFRGFSQQDSQEFIRCFLNIIHEELKYPIGNSASKPLLSPSTLSTTSSAPTDDPNSDGIDTIDSGMSTENESFVNQNHQSTKTSEVDEEEPLNLPNEAEENSADEETKDAKPDEPPEKDKPSSSSTPKVNYESVVSVVFDGQLISTVKCLTCQHLSNTEETFQDISLSIPSIEQLEKMKEAFEEIDATRTQSGNALSSDFSYFHWFYNITNRWFIQPWFSWISNFYRYIFSGSISLEDCLCAFFAADHLRGEDMYKCEKCDKLRNGVKQCRLKSLPEVLSIHLKRFRHDHLYNTKINTRITFPLRDLDLQPYMCENDEAASSKDGDNQSNTYDLIAIVCHHGSNVDFGHYISYGLNQIDGSWYEFDDSFVRKVSEEKVASAEAYVLFYQKRSLYALDEVDDF